MNNLQEQVAESLTAFPQVGKRWVARTILFYRVRCQNLKAPRTDAILRIKRKRRAK